MSLDEQMGKLTPERRWSLYNRIADVLHEHGAEEASKSARKIAAEAVAESPRLQAELQKYLDALAGP